MEICVKLVFWSDKDAAKEKLVPPAIKPNQRLSRVTLSGQVAEQLRDDILAGALLPNAQLNEKELALAFGVSRGPLREAMQRLIQEGLLRSEPHRGVFVVEISEPDLADIFFVRIAIESAAVKQLVTSRNTETISSQLSQISEKMDNAVRAKRWKDGSELDFEFHRTLVDAAGSNRLSRTYMTVQAETRLCLHRLMGGYRRSEDLAEEHFRFADTLNNGDLEKALDELSRHFGDPVAIMRRTRNGDYSEHPVDPIG